MYHYTTGKAWREMNEGREGWLVYDAAQQQHIDGGTVRGLWPSAPFIVSRPGLTLPDDAHRGAIFGLEEPEPRKWIAHAECPKSWPYLMGSITRGEPTAVLLQVELGTRDLVEVVDRIHFERLRNTRLRDDAAQTALRNDAYLQYWESRRTVSEYDGSHELPEIVVWNPIPLTQITKVSEMSAQEISTRWPWPRN